jgi:hypothetical protein
LLKLDASVFLANATATLGLPSAAYAPERTVAVCTVKPDVLVHADTSPVSNPSENTGGAAAGVITTAELPNADTLPAASRARTVYEYADPANTVESV